MLTNISQEEFLKIDPLFRVIEHDHPRRFGVLRLPGCSYPLTLCWQGDLIEPAILNDPRSSAIWIGVDQRVVALSQRGNTLLSLGLHTPLLQLKAFDVCVIVLCETEVLAVNRTFSLRSFSDLKDIASDVSVKGEELIITFVDGSTERMSF